MEIKYDVYVVTPSGKSLLVEESVDIHEAFFAKIVYERRGYEAYIDYSEEFSGLSQRNHIGCEAV